MFPRMFKTYRSLFKFAVKVMFQFRFENLTRIIADVAWFSLSFIFFSAIFSHTSDVVGFSKEEIFVFLSYTVVVQSIAMVFFEEILWRFPDLINKGAFDSYLTRPIPTIFFATAQFIRPVYLMSLFCSFLLIAYFLYQLPEFPPLQNFLLCIFIFGPLGLAISFMMMLVCVLPSLWSGSDRSLSWCFWPLNDQLAEKPHLLFKGFFLYFIIWILPFALINSIPATVLLKGASWTLFFQQFSVSLILFVVVRLLWKTGLKRYSSASS